MPSSIHLTQLIGAPLYWMNRDLFDAYMTLTKKSFGILITTMTNWWSPTTIRISGDASVAEQIRKTRDGRVEFMFPDRLIMIANHQVLQIKPAHIMERTDRRLRSIPIGSIYGGLGTPTSPGCMATCTSS